MLAVMAKEEEFAKNEKARERNENEMKKVSRTVSFFVVGTILTKA